LDVSANAGDKATAQREKKREKDGGGDSGAATTSSAVSSAGVMVNVDQVCHI